MGTIVAVRTNSGIAIGADCINTFEEIVHSSLNFAESCISKLGESYIGINCGYALQQSAQSIFESLISESSAELHLTNRAAVRSFFSSHFDHLRTLQRIIPQQQGNVPFETLPMNALIINRHGLFKVDATRSVYEYKKYWAIGSGEAFALGALHASFNEEADAESLIRTALKACGAFEANRNREILVRSIRLPNLKLAPADKEKSSTEKGKVLIHRGPVSIKRGKRGKKRDLDGSDA